MRVCQHVEAGAAKQRWAEFQRQSGLSTTQQRELIVETFFATEGHVSIDELHALVRRRSPRVAHATVYRTIKLLVACGLAQEQQFRDKEKSYEAADEVASHHDHLICTACGHILEFENQDIERIQAEVATGIGGFKIVRHKLELYGLCPRAQGHRDGYCPNPGHWHGPRRDGGS